MDTDKPNGKKPRKAATKTAGNNAALANEPSSAIKQPLTVPMEVHHHPELPHGEKKRFKEYLLEGLMIFIAVTMGFFAESLREHINNNDKEQQYIETFAEDLQTDSVNMVGTFAELDSVTGDIHSLITMLGSPASRGGNYPYGAQMYYDARIATRNLTFYADDRTVTQLKNSGGYSLITDKALVDSIISYEGQIERYGLANSIALQEGQLLYPYISKIFNAPVFETMVNSQYIIKPPAGNPQLISSDPALINELIYYLHQRESTMIGSIVFLKKVQARNRDIYKYLAGKYHVGE